MMGGGGLTFHYFTLLALSSFDEACMRGVDMTVSFRYLITTAPTEAVKQSIGGTILLQLSLKLFTLLHFLQ